MAEYSAVIAQTVAASANAVFTETPVRGGNCVAHREGSGLVTLRGITNHCRARYRVAFGANIRVPAGGTEGPVSVALAIDGEALGAATAIVTPAAAGDLNYVGGDIFVDVPRGCCVSVSVKNVGTDAITVANLNLIAERVA